MFHAPQINLYSADLPASVAFYVHVGFQETFRTPTDGEPIHVELRLDGFTVGIADVESARRDHGLAVGTDGTGIEIVLWVDDLDAAYADLLAYGAAAMSEPHDWLSNLRIAWVADPDGNPVQLVQKRA